jgi:hypothetical protein
MIEEKTSKQAKENFNNLYSEEKFKKYFQSLNINHEL